MLIGKFDIACDWIRTIRTLGQFNWQFQLNWLGKEYMWLNNDSQMNEFFG